jgi:four helix bundle protein
VLTSLRRGASGDTRRISSVSDGESEAEETRVWLEFALRCRYINKEQAQELDQQYDNIIGQLVRMLSEPQKWTIR